MNKSSAVFKIFAFCFWAYLLVLFSATFFLPLRERSAKVYEYYFIPFENIINQIKSPDQYIMNSYWRFFIQGLIGNIILFMPFGFFASALNSKPKISILSYGIALSIFIELLQLLLHSGVCDIDDVMLNALGCWFGIIIYRLTSKHLMIS